MSSMNKSITNAHCVSILMLNIITTINKSHNSIVEHYRQYHNFDIYFILSYQARTCIILIFTINNHIS